MYSKCVKKNLGQILAFLSGERSTYVHVCDACALIKVKGRLAMGQGQFLSLSSIRAKDTNLRQNIKLRIDQVTTVLLTMNAFGEFCLVCSCF